MEIKEAIEIITNAVQTEGMTAEQDKALAVIQKLCQKLDNGYTLCKVDEAIEKMYDAEPPERIMDYEDNIVSGFNYGRDAAINILQEACL